MKCTFSSSSALGPRIGIGTVVVLRIQILELTPQLWRSPAPRDIIIANAENEQSQSRQDYKDFRDHIVCLELNWQMQL